MCLLQKSQEAIDNVAFFNAVSWTEAAALNSWPLWVVHELVPLHLQKHRNMQIITSGIVTLNHNVRVPDSFAAGIQPVPRDRFRWFMWQK